MDQNRNRKCCQCLCSVNTPNEMGIWELFLPPAPLYGGVPRPSCQVFLPLQMEKKPISLLRENSAFLSFRYPGISGTAPRSSLERWTCLLAKICYGQTRRLFGPLSAQEQG